MTSTTVDIWGPPHHSDPLASKVDFAVEAFKVKCTLWSTIFLILFSGSILLCATYVKIFCKFKIVKLQI